MNYIFPISVLVIVAVVLGIASFSNFELDNFHYDRLKKVVIKWSYLVTFIALIVKTLDVSYGFETVTIVAGFGAMLAGLLDVSESNWDGEEIDEFEDEIEEGDE